MRYLGYPLTLSVLGLFAAGVFGLLGLLSDAAPSAAAPANVQVQLNFGGPGTVLFCWTQADRAEVTSYDLQVVRWNFGRTRTEVLRRAATSDCGSGVGAAHTFNENNLYHVNLRACREGRCSDWVEASANEAYWFQIPCAEGCFHPRSTDDGASSRSP